jgi:hypothetical protein
MPTYARFSGIASARNHLTTLTCPGCYGLCLCFLGYAVGHALCPTYGFSATFPPPAVIGI